MSYLNHNESLLKSVQIFLLVLYFFGLMVLPIGSVFISLLLLLIGVFALKIIKQGRTEVSFFLISYFAYTFYTAVLWIIKDYFGYSYLQSFDGIKVYIPYTVELLQDNHNLFTLIDEIYGISRYSFVGSILIPFYYIGKVSRFLDTDLYLSIQQVIVLFSAIAIPVVYKILKSFVDNEKMVKQAIILYALLSIHLYMSAYIVRDMPITLMFYVIIYICTKKFTVKRLITMLLFTLLIATLRLSSAIFASVFIIYYLYNVIKVSKIFYKLISLTFLIIVIGFIFSLIDVIQNEYEKKSESYINKQSADQEGESTIASFNILPPGVSHFTKMIYNQLMPIPVWRKMMSTSDRPEVNNISNFALFPATLFQYFVWFLLFYGLIKMRKTLFNKKILIGLFVISLVFLMLQSTTMGHRRMLGVYPIFFTLATITHLNLNHKIRLNIVISVVLLFILLQIAGIIKVI
jgi:hypothetical protein